MKDWSGGKNLNPEQNTDFFLSDMKHSTDTQKGRILIKLFAWLDSVFVSHSNILVFNRQKNGMTLLDSLAL